MKELDLTKAMKQAITENPPRIKELLIAYDNADFYHDLQREHIKDIAHRVLAEHEFYASFGDCGIAIGERITEEEQTFALNNVDFERLMALEAPILTAEGITDEQGEYIHDYYAMQLRIGHELSEIVIPQEYQKTFLNSVAFQDKLISILKKLVK